MRTRADTGAPLPALATAATAPVVLVSGLVTAGVRAARETGAVLSAIQSLPDLVRALDRLAPAADALAQLAEARSTLDELAAQVRHLPETLEQLRMLHEQVVAVACDLRALEPEIQGLAETTAALDESIRVLAGALGPLQGTTERVGRLVDRLPERRRRP
ncbi:hypothetical protein IQ251_02895 [Saccharopolyspora sp. HNM0983]|uniref:Uncharacterized protein n=1 Tax=Saccharopolyspora montiporae TaxID=2781240 RepID=A0A929FZ51_9PSEU|nr:hypothetical protein [Saccharopolyspora sp. HNM0983]MBE9373387.1 hypothetical protein [Saccharopolyspora sp. HNM0983]